MTHYIETRREFVKNTGVITPVVDSMDRWTGLSKLSRYLLENNAVQDLSEKTARSVYEILDLDYCQVATLEKNGNYYYRAIAQKKDCGIYFQANSPVSQLGEKTFHEVAFSEPALRPFYLNEAFIPEECMACSGTFDAQIWLVPLQANGKHLGFLILGKNQTSKVTTSLIESTHLVDLIAGQFSNALYRVHLNEKLSETTRDIVQALMKALAARDLDSSKHSQRMAELSQQLAIKMGCSEEESLDIYLAALLHDIGKIGVEDEILLKPGPLTAEEWEKMRQHPQIGAKIIQGMTQLDQVAPLILEHHERLDGSGYPAGLQRDQISFGAKLIAVVDSFMAMIEERKYRTRKNFGEAVDELKRNKEILFDGKVVDSFIEMINNGNVNCL
jgi:putative nucleotidyltransferase with HDIG domain